MFYCDGPVSSVKMEKYLVLQQCYERATPGYQGYATPVLRKSYSRTTDTATPGLRLSLSRPTSDLRPYFNRVTLVMTECYDRATPRPRMYYSRATPVLR